MIFFRIKRLLSSNKISPSVFDLAHAGDTLNHQGMTVQLDEYNRRTKPAETSLTCRISASAICKL